MLVRVGIQGAGEAELLHDKGQEKQGRDLTDQVHSMALVGEQSRKSDGNSLW